MRAPENQSVDAALLEPFKIYLGRHFDHLIIRPAFLNERNKKRASAAVNLHGGIGRFQGMSIGAALYCRIGADDTDSLVFAALDRAPHSWFDNPNHRHSKTRF